MDIPIWGTIHGHHRSWTPIHVTPVGDIHSALGDQTNSHHCLPHDTNGLVERFHRQLKAALKVSPHLDRWIDMLLLALLRIRTSLKEDIKGTAAELLYGTSLCLPGEFFIRPVVSSMDPTSYITLLKSSMQACH